MQADIDIQKSRFKKLLVKHLVFIASVGGAIAFLTFTGIGCPFRAITGIPCPTCGLTRSVLALLRFDLKASLGYFPLTVPLLAAIGIALHLDVIEEKKKICKIFVITTAIFVFINYTYFIINEIIN